LDAAALHTFDSFDKAVKLIDFRKLYPPDTKWTLRTFDIDGRLLERWFLKTLINISFDKEWIIGPGSREAGKPSQELIEVAFGQRSFGQNEGLHVSVHVGYEAHLRQGLSFAGLTDGSNLVGARFTFASLKFLLSLYPNQLHFDGGSQLIRHIRYLNFGMTASRVLGKQSHRIRFRW
jgi:hypothetical protein